HHTAAQHTGIGSSFLSRDCCHPTNRGKRSLCPARMTRLFFRDSNLHLCIGRGANLLCLALCLVALRAAVTGTNICLDSTAGNNVFKCAAGETTINLSGCGITDADSLDLDSCLENAGADSILNIYLNENSLTALPADLFQDLEALQTLYLGGNPLVELNSTTFGGLASLQRLWINGCGLTSLPLGLFDGLGRLQHLYLHSNDLS
ncbi:unnamed protein product, partial [Pylaiella littoralis]